MNQIRKNLASLLRKTAIITSMTIPLSFLSCEPENYPPEAKLEVNPAYGDAPLSVRMKLTGNDLNGVEDIKEYRLSINTEVVKSKTPIDITRTFENPGTIQIYGEVIDYENESDKTEVKSIQVYKGPFIEQTASLVNDVEIKYSATLSKVSKAQLKINREGVSILTEEIKDVVETGIDFEKTFKYSPDGITKGNYSFNIKSDNLEQTTSVSVPNYNPNIDVSNIKPDVNQDSEISVTLPTPSDKNPEDNPVAITSAKSLDEKTQLTLIGYDLKIKALSGKTGNYQVEVEYGSTDGGLEKKTISGNIIPHTWKYLVNPFVSTNSNGAAYDLLKTRAQKDSLIQAKLNEDWVNEMKYNANPLWDCTEYKNQLMINFLGFPGLTGYSGNNLDSIYFYHRTLKDNGKYGLPVYGVAVGDEHEMNCILTGDNAEKFEDWNFIEPQRDSINVKPGQLYMPMNCEIEIRAPPKDNEGKQLPIVPILKFKVEKGVSSLIWENNDPNLKIIKQR